MKKNWQNISTRIDALTLRERAMLFAGAAGVLIFMVFFFALNPNYARQRNMLQEMAQQQDKIAVVEVEIAQTIEAHTIDPDAADRARLAKIRTDAQSLSASLTDMQAGMVAPERMTAMLEQIVRAHRGLRLKSLRTLGERAPDTAAAVLAGAATPVAPAAAPGDPVIAELLHRHGVELVVQGSYGDLVSYMAALENMQGRIFWGSAELKVDSWPDATLSLTVYTINLDKKWLKL
ncbi:MAG: type II secretion system protein M [Massilia sp.]|nr:type II secretion system protein M [Massilia sp.]